MPALRDGAALGYKYTQTPEQKQKASLLFCAQCRH